MGDYAILYDQGGTDEKSHYSRPYNTMATTIFGPMDILNQAGRLWNRVTKSPQTPFFEVTIASADGRPIRSVNNIYIEPHCSIEDVKHTDLVLISSATYKKFWKRTQKLYLGYSIITIGGPMSPAFALASSCWRKPDFLMANLPQFIGDLLTCSAKDIRR